MEKIDYIPQKDFSKGVYIELDCFVCGHNETLVDEEELEEMLKESDWRKLDSDEMGAVGHWCGCDTKEERF